MSDTTESKSRAVHRKRLTLLVEKDVIRDDNVACLRNAMILQIVYSIHVPAIPFHVGEGRVSVDRAR